MGRVFTIIAFTGLGIAGGFYGGKWFNPPAGEPSDQVNSEAQIESVLAEGKIKPAGGIRMVSTLPGRKIAAMNVKVGSKTIAGQTEICIMADEPLLKMQWELAAARKEDLGTEVDQKILAAELNQSSAAASLKEAQLNQARLGNDSPESSYVDKKIESSQKKLNRLKELAKAEETSAFVSSQDIFDQELELEKARAEKESLKQAANLAVETAEKALQLANKALENAKSARKESKSLNLAEAIAKEQYDSARVYAPADGEVVKIHMEAGDTVSNFPILEIADLRQMIVEAEVYFANLSAIQSGQKVTISSPALENDLTGKVVSKSNYIGNGMLLSPNPLAMADQETAKVVIEIDQEFTDIAKSFLNLQVTVEIDTE